MSVRSGLSLFTRISVAVLVSLTLITAAVTAFVVIHSTPTDAALDGPADLARAGSTVVAPSTGTAARYLKGYLSKQPAEKGVPWPERTLTDLLPNHLFSVDGAAPKALAAGIVVGDISGVSGGMSVSASDGSAVAFDAENVSSRVAVFDIAIRQGFGEVNGLSSIRVALTLGGDVDPELALTGLGDLGTVIVVLDAPGTAGDAPTVYSVRHDAALLGFVDGSGTVTFPALGDREAAFLGSLTTVDAITSASLDSVETGTIENGVIR